MAAFRGHQNFRGGHFNRGRGNYPSTRGNNGGKEAHISHPSNPPQQPNDSLAPIITPSIIPSIIPSPPLDPSQHTFFNTSVSSISNTHPMQTRSKFDISKKKAFHSFVASDVPSDLASYSVASKYPEWRAAMAEEFAALQEQGTWLFVAQTDGMNVVGCKWIFRTKYHLDGTIARYKACLVAKEYHHVEGFDFDETFSPVIKKPTIRIILTLTATFGWSLTQLDVKNAFLHGSSGMVLFYVDNIIVTGHDNAYMQTLKNDLVTEFQISDLGELKYFLGLEIHKHSSGLFVNQAKYLTDLLTKSGMLNAKACATLMSLPWISLLQLLISLMYPYIDNLWDHYNILLLLDRISLLQLIKILRYLCGTRDLGVLFRPGDLSLTAYCYADWVHDAHDCRLTTGFVTLLGSSSISWSAKKQQIVS
ncbi:uncharacterized protein LOC111008814 [Momordica charantia]|uniref:Uncharacterized protein LOC111008814 n=1 Tax=Momordica charantia TaxID=3673 RepID=A0A6J1C6X1_MOMCH|nr:uncharacterized protein LOC111008814 [Momordica charantia]